MSEDKLLLYYLRASKLGTNKENYVVLNEIADAMFTSPRHCRSLLKAMTEAGWLEWSPKSGRNKRSALFLKYQPSELKIKLASKLILSGKYEKALGIIDNDQTLFGALLQHSSGTSRREGNLHIQLTYLRPFSDLLPHKQQRNSERFLLRQIYSCLTKSDGNGNITPDLAHHWLCDEEQNFWRFYLRPQISFHDGSEINSSTIEELFNRLRTLPEYCKELDHITSIVAINPYCIEFRLDQPDPGFAGLLSDVRYSIQPVSQLSSSALTIGSGPFYVEENTNRRLQLKAFNNYYGCRPVTESVSIWQLATKETDVACNAKLITNTVERQKEQLPYTKDKTEQSVSHQHNRIEDGCLMMIFNHRAALSGLQRKYLSGLLDVTSLENILVDMKTPIEAIPADNLLPQWSKIYHFPVERPKLPEKLTIALYQHQSLPKCANAIASILEREGIVCEVNSYPFEDFHQIVGANELNEDLVLTSLNLDDNRPSSAFRWFLSSQTLHNSLTAETSQWLTQELLSIRRSKPLKEYMLALEHISNAMIGENWIFPLFHHRQTVHFEGVLKGVSITAWGWPSIQEVWSED